MATLGRNRSNDQINESNANAGKAAGTDYGSPFQSDNPVKQLIDTINSKAEQAVQSATANNSPDGVEGNPTYIAPEPPSPPKPVVKRPNAQAAATSATSTASTSVKSPAIPQAPKPRQPKTDSMAPVTQQTSNEKNAVQAVDAAFTDASSLRKPTAGAVDPVEKAVVDNDVNELSNQSSPDLNVEEVSTTYNKIGQTVRNRTAESNVAKPSKQKPPVGVTPDGILYNEDGEPVTIDGTPEQDASVSENAPNLNPKQPDSNYNTSREDIDEFMRESSYTRYREAKNKNRANSEAYATWRNEFPNAPESDFLESNPFDQEAFDNMLGSLVSEHYRSLDDYERKSEEGDENQENKEQNITGKTRKETLKQDRLIDRLVDDIRIGFFHVNTEHLREEDGKTELRWSKPAEDAMVTVMDLLGLHGIDGQRNVFRLVRLYASMSTDRQGKMFNEGRDEWSLTEQEFIDVCRCIATSCIQWGNPMVMPSFLGGEYGGRRQLRGTDMYPSGVMPRVVAEAITGPDSILGESADDLIDRCKDEWVNRTYPMMKANLVNKPDYGKKKKKGEEEPKQKNLEAQRVVIEDMQQALARLDGKGAEAFSTEYGVDTTLHYTLAEYEDVNAEYASAMNGNYDSDAVQDLQDKKMERYRKLAAKRQSRKQVGSFEAGANIVVSGMKTNALFWNVPIMISAIAEKGVGDVQTWLATKAIQRATGNREDFAVSKDMRDAFKTHEASEAIDAALLLLECGGPGALQMFVEDGHTLSHAEATKYLNEEFFPSAKNPRSQKIMNGKMLLDRVSQKILAGDMAFKKFDAMNYLNALMVSNQVLADTQAQLAKAGDIDTYGSLALTASEMEDVLAAHNGDVARFLTEMVGKSAGRDALIMMRANNIAQFNPISYKVNQVLRDHGIGNLAVAAFIDTFATYGINFIYSIVPFSRSITYIQAKMMEVDGNLTAADFTIGGGMGKYANDSLIDAWKNNPGFKNGLIMNMMFDGITLGRWLLTGGLLGAVFALLRFEPPDDPKDILNVSKWKIGGEEIQWAYWINDLTQWGLPLAYATAALMSGQSKETAAALMLDSMYDQIDGNVVLDCAEGIKNFGLNLAELEKMSRDPNYEGNGIPLSYAAEDLVLKAWGKIAPGSPLYRQIGKSTLFQGDYGRARSSNYEFDKSSDWKIEQGVTKYIDDPRDRLLRKHSANDWTVAVMSNLIRNTMSDDPASKTGYLWWEMPVRTKADQLTMVWANKFKLDYDEWAKAVENGEDVCQTWEGHCAQKTDELLNEIKQFDNVEQAIRSGFFIPHDIRKEALNTIYAEINATENEFRTRELLQDFDTYDDWYAAKQAKKDRVSELYGFIDTWLKNDDIPEWNEGYEQILSDYDLTYTHEDGTPAFAWEALFNPSINVEWALKGNHPNNLLPFTTVDKSSNDIVQRGWSGETVPFWYNDGTDLNFVKSITNAVGEAAKVPYGQDAGEYLNDVLFGEEYDGQRLHPDKPTIDWRAYIPREQYLPEDIKGFKAEDSNGGIYGDLGVKADDGDSDDKNNTTPWKGYSDQKPWKNSGTKSYYNRSSYSKGSNYSPRIYANLTNVHSTSTSSTHISTSPRSVNADRAATMYTKQPGTPQVSYLRPGFATKGSREAYKRQDI